MAKCTKGDNTVQNWNVQHIPSQQGRVAIVTGANSGLGYEVSKALANAGATVVMACRTPSRAEAARDALIAEGVAGDRLVLMTLDLASQQSVREFAEAYHAEYQQLDLLMNNAGISNPPYRETPEGWESQMGTNHLGHFALTGRLLDLLLATPGSRVVTMSSYGEQSADPIDFDNLLYTGGKDYHPMKTYNRSKLCNVLFTYELQRKLEAAGAQCIACAAHPGGSKTDLIKDPKGMNRILLPAFKLVAQSAAMGALPELRAATDLDVVGGTYYAPSKWHEMKGSPKVTPSSAQSYDVEVAARLWLESERLTGVTFTFA
ncbi:short-chain dehydrogenase/reductase SDR [Kipferlia bialata]|uniref:Short-chain dehydrogenase/reductase SDR n=1 Tax=Kipferlia bialata TaxID=797122 RepID=A0A9K3CZP9_9EUKA|nr:short-chain dehydrogenase/reductase SDR [Kipferlia bialata]|eukprot:g7220.t1